MAEIASKNHLGIEFSVTYFADVNAEKSMVFLAEIEY